ncbi:MAG: hypothetical protein ACTTM1_01050 [Candidatus Karelsulcia muelleri]
MANQRGRRGGGEGEEEMMYYIKRFSILKPFKQKKFFTSPMYKASDEVTRK